MSNLPPSGEIPRGAIRFNTDSNKPELWDGSQWAEFQLSTPNLGTSADTQPGVRGVWGGRYVTPAATYSNTMDYANLDSTGNAIDFGDALNAKTSYAGVSDRTRGLYAGGYFPSGSPSKFIDTIETITISSTGGGVDYSDLSQGRNALAGASNSTRAVFAGGTTPSTVDTIDYITIQSTANAVDFGNLTQARFNLTACQSSTRAVFAGGASPTFRNTIDFVTTSTLGDAVDFGDLAVAKNGMQGSGCSNSIRGIFSGGLTPSSTNTMEYITIATLGNAMNFGDMIVVREAGGGCSSSTRAVIGGGGLSPGSTNAIDYVQIMTIGNAVDFGDLTVPGAYIHALSNGHGGL